MLGGAGAGVGSGAVTTGAVGDGAAGVTAATTTGAGALGDDGIALTPVQAVDVAATSARSILRIGSVLSELIKALQNLLSFEVDREHRRLYRGYGRNRRAVRNG